jgi:hypothetical protein
MLSKLYNIVGHTISANDGEIGKVEDFYFDDHFWHVRYLVVDTGTWLPGRRVLISPAALGPVLPNSQQLIVNLTRERIRNSPGVNTDKPISREREAQLTAYYGWPIYWAPGSLVGAPSAPEDSATKGSSGTERQLADTENVGDPHLRSVKEVAGYHIEATDGMIGHVEDFLVEDEGWIIRYLLIDTKNWLPGRKVLAWPQLIDSVSWAERKVRVPLGREIIKSSPEYDPKQPLGRDYEALLYTHYGERGYWLKESSAMSSI